MLTDAFFKKGLIQLFACSCNLNFTCFSTTIRMAQDMTSHGSRPVPWCQTSSTPWMTPLTPWRPWMAQRMMMGKRYCGQIACDCLCEKFTPTISHTHVQWCTHTHTHTNTHTHRRTHTNTYRHTHTWHTHLHMHTHTHTHTHEHMYAYTNTHTPHSSPQPIC